MNQPDTSPATTDLPEQKAVASSTKPRRGYQRHGFTSLLENRFKGSKGQIDGRTALGRALAEWKAELIEALGGNETISPQERVLIETCARDHVILSSIDAWLMRQPSLVHSKKRTTYPIVLQRAQLADSLTRRLQAIGLKRRPRPTKSLADLLTTESTTGRDV
jgi:hypothetical protein